jgi:predicted phage terminase large subunit-like protein
LEKTARGECKRLAVFMPPGSAKSTYGSVLFPPHYMANAPGKSIIAASHTVELAEKWGRRIRSLIGEHGVTLGIELSQESQAAGRWALSSGGEYYAAGVGTGIAGFRADGVIIDDPVRSHEDAYSETTREKVWDWYKSDLTTRLRPGGWITLIMTRWHEDDLAARALNEDHWEIINLPAEAEPGDLLGREPGQMLWDDDYGYANFLRHEKETQPPRNWSALFQQRPAPETGDFFKAEWIKTYATPPNLDTLNCYLASDYAVTEGGGDWTVHVVVGVDPNDDLFVLDLWRGQKTPDVTIDAMLDLVKKWRVLGVAEEQGQIKSAIGPFLKKRMEERKIYVAREGFPSRHDKAIRAQSIRGRMAVRGIAVPANAPWLADFKSELFSFPVGRHDDIVDCLSLVGQILDRMSRGAPVAEKPKQKILSTDPNLCTVTLEDLFEAEERRHKRGFGRI